MHFLLHLPNCTPADLESRCRAAGLSHLLGGHDVLPAHAGPRDTTGVMVGWLSPQAPHMHYAAERQQWFSGIVRGESGPLYSVGIWTADPPKENELRRHYTQAGPLIELAGQRWKMPTPDTVDSRAVYADDGSMRWEVVRQFAWMCDEARSLRETYLEEFGIRQTVFQIDPSAQINWLLKLLQVNYRITPEIAVALDLWIGKEKLLDIFLTTLGLQRKQNG